MIRNSGKHTSSAGWWRLVLAGSVASGLLVLPLAQAEDQAPAQPATGAWAAPGAVPPPPGPYGAPPQFRPDQELETAGAAYALPPPPPGFSDNTRGPLTRDEFLSQQEERRKQLDAYHDQRQQEMQSQRDAWQQQRDDDPCNKRMQEQSAQMQQEWEQRKAEQDQRWNEMQAEREKQWENRNAPAGGATAPAAPAPEQAAAQQTAPPTAPAYGGYPAPAPAYGYGYPPPPPGYGAPGWGYPGYPAPAAGGAVGNQGR